METHDAEILFHEALAWGHAYGPAMGSRLWDEMRTEMAKKFVERLDPILTDAYAEGRKDEAEESARLKAALDDAWKVLRMVDDNNRAEAGESVKSWRGSFVVEEVQRVLSAKLGDYAKRPADDMVRLPNPASREALLSDSDISVAAANFFHSKKGRSASGFAQGASWARAEIAKTMGGQA